MIAPMFIKIDFITANVNAFWYLSMLILIKEVKINKILMIHISTIVVIINIRPNKE